MDCLHNLDAPSLIALCSESQRKGTIAAEGLNQRHYHPPFTITGPDHVSNDELLSLKPLYQGLLNQHQGAMWSVIESMKPDGCAAMLYALQYPSLIVDSRRDSTGLARATNSEKFPLHTICRSIDDNDRLVKWCRDTLVLPPTEETTPDCIIGSCIQLLRSASGAFSGYKRPESKRILASVILRNDSTFHGIGVLYDDIALVLSTRPNLPAASVAAACQLVRDAAKSLFGERKAPDVLTALGSRQPAVSQFRACVQRCIKEFGQETACELMASVGVSLTKRELERALHAPLDQVSTPSQAPDLKTCDRPGCCQRGIKVCSRCGLSKYCGRECQIADWSAHKSLCKDSSRRSQNRAEVRAALNILGKQKSAALVQMEKFLADNPEYDYKLTSDPKKDVGIMLDISSMRVGFRTQRLVAADPDAPQEKRVAALKFMQKTLAGSGGASQFSITESQVHGQLVAEYGVKF